MCNVNPHKVSKIKYAPGELNPIAKNYITKTVCIDTLFRDNYTTTNASSFIYTLPVPINNVLSMNIVAAEIPHSWYAFSDSAKNNKFRLFLHNVCSTDIHNIPILDDNGDPVYISVVHEIIIPPGNYLSDDLVSCINNILLNTKNGADYIVFDISYSNIKSIFRARMPIDGCAERPMPYDTDNDFYSPNFHFELLFDTQPEQGPAKQLGECMGIGWMLGFNKPRYDITYVDTHTSFDKTEDEIVYYKAFIQSDSIFGRPMIMQYIFIDIDDYNNNFAPDTIVSKTRQNGQYIGKNILARFTVDNSPGTVITADNSSFINRQRDYFGPVTINKFHIKLIDKYGNLIDLNGCDYHIVFEFNVSVNNTLHVDRYI